MSPFDDPKFKVLRERWYSRLRESGFKDIENDRGDLTDHQTVYDFSQRVGFKKDLVDDVREYFSWAGEMVHHGKFKCAADRKIWTLHAIGKSSIEISHATQINDSWIRRKIKKIRVYLRDQAPRKS